MTDEGLVGYYNTGYQDGVEAERKRILDALRQKSESRNIFQALEYPFLIEELEQTIMLDQTND